MCDGGNDWGRVTKATAISHINYGTHTNYFNEDGSRSNVRVIRESDGSPYLSTTADKTWKNNPDNLDDC